MPSTIAWLDASREDQRRMREIVNLFAQSESRDELGIGQVRDAFSDSLFPGTSTLHTRARYLLFVPWCFVTAAARGSTAARRERRVEDNERALIAGLTDLGTTDGLIGRVAGVAVKTLPSTLYWGALRQYAILQVAEPLDALGLSAVPDPDQEELAERIFDAWSSTLPPVPAGFPRHPRTGFELSRAEATWLQERMLGGTEGSLLHHLVSDGHRPQPTSDTPWDDPICHTSAPVVQRILEHARLFSLAVHGASFLYNLLIAELYVAAGHTRIENPVERYRDRLQEWAQECQRQRPGAVRLGSPCILAAHPGRESAGAPGHPRISHDMVQPGLQPGDRPGRRRQGTPPADRRPGAHPEGQPIPARQRSTAGGLVRPVGHPPTDLPVDSGQQDRPGPARRAGGS